jgi:hypothetical protein
MQQVGYSGTPLPKKLGLTTSSKLLLVAAPDNYFDLLRGDFSKKVVKSGKQADLVHLFVVELKDLKKQFLKLIK